MLKIDTADFTRLANEYKQRAAGLRSRPLGDDHSAIGFAVKDLFKDVLLDNEGVSLTRQKHYYSQTGTGYYGSGSVGNDPDKINPQEWLDPGHKGILGTGRFYGSSDTSVTTTGDGGIVDLYTLAEMQPYPNKKRLPGGGYKETFFEPQRPIMYYFRHGWKNPDNPKHHMKKRLIGKRVAEVGAARNVIGRFIGKILQSAGFKRR